MLYAEDFCLDAEDGLTLWSADAMESRSVVVSIL